MVESARELECGVRFIEIRAPYEVLQARLHGRGGRLRSEIPTRLARARAFELAGPDVHVIDNSGPLAESGRAFIALLQRLVDAAVVAQG